MTIGNAVFPMVVAVTFFIVVALKDGLKKVKGKKHRAPTVLALGNFPKRRKGTVEKNKGIQIL